MTIQDNTIRDNLRHYKTVQDNIIHDKAKHDNIIQDKTRQYTPRQANLI